MWPSSAVAKVPLSSHHLQRVYPRGVFWLLAFLLAASDDRMLAVRWFLRDGGWRPGGVAVRRMGGESDSAPLLLRSVLDLSHRLKETKSGRRFCPGAGLAYLTRNIGEAYFKWPKRGGVEQALCGSCFRGGMRLTLTQGWNLVRHPHTAGIQDKLVP